MSETAFLEKTFAYLRTCHGVHAVPVDENGQAEPPDDHSASGLSVTRYYPVDFEKKVGGIRCSAKTKEAMDAAEPHILLCINGLQEVLVRDWILKQTSDEMLELSDQLHFLFNLANKVIGIQDLRDYCMVMLREISKAIHADCAMVHVQATQPEKGFQITHQLSDSAASRIQKDPALKTPPNGATVVVSLEDGTSALVAPIKEKEGHVGYMAFFKSREKRFFTSYEKKFVGTIDNIISPTIESLRLYDSLQELYVNTVKALAAAIDAKDAYTHGHSFRVAKYSISIAKYLEIPREKLSDLEVAAYMHDLGKIGVPEAILSKPGRLTEEEFTEIKKHPVLTDKILEPIELPDFIVDAAVQHHERLNGGGYPLGLRGDEISLFARIIAVADVFDALTSARPYRDAMSVEEALTILCKGIDEEYDRHVVLALVSALQNEKGVQELAKLYPELKFLKIEQMNQFLKELTTILVVKDSETFRVTPIDALRAAASH
jgi:HD-GYP domain-containing protein (c-di-GMP phosphodiesterase class II)